MEWNGMEWNGYNKRIVVLFILIFTINLTYH